jgi:hypothetical protein
MPALPEFNNPTRFLWGRFQQLNQWLGPHSLTLVIIAISSVAGVVLALIAQSINPEDRIVVGNTAGSLTVVIETGQSRIMIGAGPSRSHAADLAGRATRPWDRSIDLLIIPGWDDYHVPGVLGLIERRSVEGIAIIGLPGEDPAWTILERAATASDVPLRYVSNPSRLELPNNNSLLVAELAGEQEGIWARFTTSKFHIDVFDGYQLHDAQIDPRIAQLLDDTVTISMRSTALPSGSTPAVAVVPQPHWQRDFTGVDANFWAGVDRNEALVISLGAEELRIPQESIEPGID